MGPRLKVAPQWWQLRFRSQTLCLAQVLYVAVNGTWLLWKHCPSEDANMTKAILLCRDLRYCQYEFLELWSSNSNLLPQFLLCLKKHHSYPFWLRLITSISQSGMMPILPAECPVFLLDITAAEVVWMKAGPRFASDYPWANVMFLCLTIPIYWLTPGILRTAVWKERVNSDQNNRKIYRFGTLLLAWSHFHMADPFESKLWFLSHCCSHVFKEDSMLSTRGNAVHQSISHLHCMLWCTWGLAWWCS